MPNYIKVDSKPFHPDAYVGPEQEDEELNVENIRERSMTIKLKVENTLRWRWAKNKDGADVCPTDGFVLLSQSRSLIIDADTAVKFACYTLV